MEKIISSIGSAGDILIAFGVVFAIALVLGILLSVLTKLFYVAEDPRKEQIRQCLPGINCGACGCKGCDDYAAAVALGEMAHNRCTPGAQSVATQLAQIVGAPEEIKVEDKVAFVACNGHCDATAPRAEYEGLSSCQAANMLYGGAGSCRFGCLGYGDCATACPSGAICMEDGIAHVLTDRCLGCGLCVGVCPKSIISLVPQETIAVVMCSNRDKGAVARKVCQNACIGCKKCEKNCPQGAISVENNLAVIDYTKCNHCGTCVEGCPTDCLKEVFFPDLPQGVDCEDLLG